MHQRFLPLVAVVLLAACAGPAPAENPEPTTPYFPLEVGSTWSYRCGENRFQLKVAGFDKVGATNCARIELIVNNKTQVSEHIAVTKDAALRYSFDGKKADPPIPFLKLPVKPGQTWKVEAKVDGGVLKGGFKSGSEENVKVPAGTYKTATVTGVDLEANGVKLGLTYYFAEKVGMVKQVIEISGRKIIIELEKYEPGKK